ncbi:hypothetical protein BLX88_07800 [Bacillus obstructivus]|uniref:DUF5391 family protein n=1 Tax=Heyndrickxia oleronia TaxID=38875 RepID=UPI0007170B8C|nr:DUF5391 family protein [Heyndrickxia oleronia]OJH19554.1 hypothetical protein BLX88_07800 [Bacillus obstructivus]
MTTIINTKKQPVIIFTFISAIFFCLITVAISLSPLSELGPNANKFGSTGMWSAIGMILICYLVPLFLFIIGVKGMKLLMGILCGLGMFIFFSTAVTVGVVSIFTGKFPASIFIVISLCIASLIINLIWFFIAFRHKSNSDLHVT